MSPQSTPMFTPSARRRRIRAAGVAAATGAALAVWVVAAALGVDLEVAPGGDETQTVGPAAVALISGGVSLAGWGMLALLERFTGRSRPIWTIVAVAALVVSLAGPFAGVDTAVVAALATMHLAVGAVLIPIFTRS